MALGLARQQCRREEHSTPSRCWRLRPSTPPKWHRSDRGEVGLGHGVRGRVGRRRGRRRDGGWSCRGRGGGRRRMVMTCVRRMSGGGRGRRAAGGLAVVLRVVGVQPREDQHEDEDEDGRDCGGWAAEAAGPVVDGVDDPVLVAGHEGRRDRLEAGVVERQRFGGIWHRRGRDGRDRGLAGLGEAHASMIPRPGTRRPGTRPHRCPERGSRCRPPGAPVSLRACGAGGGSARQGVLVVMGTPGHEDSRDDSQHDNDRDKSPDQHRPLFNRMNGA